MCAWQYLGLCWPYPRAKSKSDQSLRKRVPTAIPICLGPYGKTGNIIIAVRGARAQLLFSHPSKLFYRSTFWIKNWFAAHSRSWEPCIWRFSHPTHWCPQSLRKRDLRKKPRNLLQSDEQCPGAPLSHLRKIPSATSGSNKGVKIVRKALSGAIARHSGDGKFYAMPHNEALVGG